MADMEFRFERGQATADELQQTIDEIVAELRDPTSELWQQARREGLKPAQLGTANVTVEETEQGIAPLVAAIVVGIAVEVGKDGMILAWKRIISPQIEKRRGGLALGEQLPNQEGEDTQEGGTQAQDDAGDETGP